MSFQIRFGVRAGGIYRPARLARRAQGRFHQLRGDTPTADGGRNSGVGDGHDPIGQRVVELRAISVHLRGESVRASIMVNDAHGFLSAPEGALAAVVAPWEVQALARFQGEEARLVAAVAVGVPPVAAPASREPPVARGGAAVGRAAALRPGTAVGPVAELRSWAEAGRAADLPRGAAAPPGAERRLGPEIGRAAELRPGADSGADSEDERRSGCLPWPAPLRGRRTLPAVALPQSAGGPDSDWRAAPGYRARPARAGVVRVPRGCVARGPPPVPPEWVGLCRRGS